MTTVLESMSESYLLATGKSTLPSDGSTKYSRLYNLTVKFHRDFQNLPDVDSEVAYDHVSAGTVTATDEFDLSEDIAGPSKRPGDRPYVLATDGTTRIYFKLVSASRLNAFRYSNAVALVGSTLKFSKAFTADEQAIGGEIRFPAYVKFDDITSVNDDVQVDATGWLQAMVAAYYVLPDAQLNYLFNDLVAEANDRLQAFIDKNGGTETTQSDEDYFAAAIGDGMC